jgi:hypothetical protein
MNYKSFIVFLDELLVYVFFYALDFVKYEKKFRCHLFYGIKLIFVLLMQKGKVENS